MCNAILDFFDRFDSKFDHIVSCVRKRSRKGTVIETNSHDPGIVKRNHNNHTELLWKKGCKVYGS